MVKSRFKVSAKGLTAVIFLSISAALCAQEKTHDIEEISFQKSADKATNQASAVKFSAKNAKAVASLSGGIETLLKTLPSVNSNAELSSQYMVRGGNYDENLIYINDIEIYRPFLIRNSLQEGMSIINPDMVSMISFSPGGFEAKYGDKMSSALNIYYREPEQNELSGEVSLLGDRLTGGLVSKNKKFTGLVSARYRNLNLVLNTLKEDTDFNPQYQDVQSYFNYAFNAKLKLSFLGYYSENRYDMVPKTRDVEFGTVLQPLKLSVFYDGQEKDRYSNMMGTVTLNYKPNKKWNLTLDNFAYGNREKEYYTIGSAYLLQPFGPDGRPTASYDSGGQIDHARNDLQISNVGSQARIRFKPAVNSDLEFGVKYQLEHIRDLTNEYQLIDSLGYNSPRNSVLPGVLNGSPLELKYHSSGANDLQASRISGYLQYTGKFLWNDTKLYVNAGVRTQYWDFNRETIFSPRGQIAVKPQWSADMLFRLAGGVYYQSPFYREIKAVNGAFNSDIQSQKSLQLILGHDYEFELNNRPFKLSSEIYYKKFNKLIPYYIDNVRTRYSGNNNAEGYAYGAETRLNGEFVPGVDSWISAGYARAFENIDGRGDIPRPSDQRLRLAVFYQDYMPKFPTMKVNLTMVYANGLPTGAPFSLDEAGNPDFAGHYQYQKTLPSYKRVDIGLSKVFIDAEHRARGPFWSGFRELSLGVQIYNAFNISNTVASQWVNDVGSGVDYAVPVRLTGRFFNAKLEFKL